MENNINSIVAVGTDPVVISMEKGLANLRRQSIIVINSSTGGQIITLAVDAQAVAGAGIQLSPGGSWQDSRDTGYYPTQKQITAIASAAGGQISLQERTGD